MKAMMITYTVHRPPHTHKQDVGDVLFVPDRFSWAAFFGGPFWLLRHRLWFRALSWVVLAFVSLVLCVALSLSIVIFFLYSLICALFVGFEGQEWRRNKLISRGWTPIKIIVGRNKPQAEQSFYESWCHTHPHAGEAPPEVPK